MASLGTLTLPITSRAPATNASRTQTPPHASPHLLDGVFAHDGAVQADGERGDGVHHQGQQDHEQDVGVGQGVPAGVWQCKKSAGDVGKAERTEGTIVGGQAPTHKGVEGAKEEMAPKLESKIKTARSRSGDEGRVCKVGNSSKPRLGSPGSGKGRTMGVPGASHLGSGRCQGLA